MVFPPYALICECWESPRRHIRCSGHEPVAQHPERHLAVVHVVGADTASLRSGVSVDALAAGLPPS